MAHRAKFKHKQLASMFSTTGYYLGKILMASHKEPSVEQWEAKSSLKAIQEHIAQFKEELEERGVLPSYDSIAYTLSEVAYPLDRLDGYFNGTCVLDVEAAYIFGFFVRAKVDELETMAKEIDEEYAKEP